MGKGGTCGFGYGMMRGSDEIGSSDIFEKIGELPRTGFGELRPEEVVRPAGGCSSNPANYLKKILGLYDTMRN